MKHRTSATNCGATYFEYALALALIAVGLVLLVNALNDAIKARGERTSSEAYSKISPGDTGRLTGAGVLAEDRGK